MTRILISYLVTMGLCVSAHGQGIIVNNGGALVINSSTATLNCADLTVKSGGTLALSNGVIASAGTFTLEDGAVFQDEGTLGLGATWDNDSAFVAQLAFNVVLTGSCGGIHFATGTGDADADGITDHGEGVGDGDSDGRPDFIDPDTTQVLGAIPVAWLQQYGLPTDNSADLVDTDGDGVINLHEFLAMTVPTNRSSVLEIESFDGTSIQWQSVGKKKYDLQRATMLQPTSDFTTVTGGIVGAQGSTSVTDPAAPPPEPYYYRVNARP